MSDLDRELGIVWDEPEKEESPDQGVSALDQELGITWDTPEIDQGKVETMYGIAETMEEPEEEIRRIDEAYVLGMLFGDNPAVVYNHTDALIEALDAIERTEYDITNPMIPGLWTTLKQSFATKAGMMITGLEPYTPGRMFGLDEGLRRTSEVVLAQRDPSKMKDVMESLQGPLFIKQPGAKWNELDPKLWKKMLETWAYNFTDFIPLLLMTGGAPVTSRILAGMIAGTSAMATAGPDPTDVATVPAIYKTSQKLIETGLMAGPMILLETGHFMDQARLYGVDPDIAEKHSRKFGPSSGIVETAQRMQEIGYFKKLTSKLAKRVSVRILRGMGEPLWEGAEEVIQGELFEHYMGKAIDEQVARDASKLTMSPGEIKAELAAGRDRDFLIGAGIGGILKGTGALSRAAFQGFTDKDKAALRMYGYDVDAIEEQMAQVEEIREKTRLETGEMIEGLRLGEEAPTLGGIREGMREAVAETASEVTPAEAPEGFDVSQLLGEEVEGEVSPIAETPKELEKRYEEEGLSIDVFESVNRAYPEERKMIELSKIVVPEEKRNQGVGTQFMEELARHADSEGKIITLTPTSDFGGTKGRLVEFYKRLGFVENKGRNRDDSISDTMYRLPEEGAVEELGTYFTERAGEKEVWQMTRSEYDEYSRGVEFDEDVYGISYKEVDEMLDRAYHLEGVKEAYGLRQVFKSAPPFELSMVVENDSELSQRYLKDLPEGTTAKDVIEAYQKKALPTEEKVKTRTPAIEIPSDVKAPPLKTIGEPKVITPVSEARAKEVWGKAVERVTPKNKAEVTAARTEAFKEYVSDQAFPEKVGLKESEINKKMRTWANIPADARKIQTSLNQGMALPTQWQGITNATSLEAGDVTAQDIDDMVGNITVTDESWWGGGGATLRLYISRALLGINTRILFNDLNFIIESTLEPRGVYDSRDKTITIRAQDPNTVAHEIGHYLDHKWGLEATGFEYDSASTLMDDYVRGLISPLREQWLLRFHEFVMDISEKGETISEYYQQRTETFARFVSRFVDWVNQQAGYYTWGGNPYVHDRFTESDYRAFVRLLQEKAYVDIQEPAVAMRVAATRGGIEAERDPYREAVERAWREGKPVPQEVLAQFPDLSQKVGIKKEVPTLSPELQEKLDRVQKQAEKKLEKASVKAVIAEDVATPEELQSVAEMLRDREMQAWKNDMEFLERMDEFGKIHVRYFKGAEEVAKIPSWVKMKVFTSNESAMDLDEMAQAVGMTDEELVQKLSEYAGIEKPSNAIRDYMEEARREFMVDKAEFVRTEAAKEITGKAIETGAKRGIAEGKKIGVAKEKARKREVEAKTKARKAKATEIKKMVKAIKKIDTSKMDPAFAEPIKSLLENIDLVKHSKKTILRLEKMRDYLENNPDAELPEKYMEKLKTLDKRDMNDITIEELREIYTTVLHYAHLEATKKRIKIGRQKKHQAEVLQEALGVMKPREQVHEDIVDWHKEFGSRFKNTGKLVKHTFGVRHNHYDLIIEKLFGINTLPYQVLYTNVKKGLTVMRKHESDSGVLLQDLIVKELKKKDTSIENVWQWSNEKVMTAGINLTRQERVSLWCHWQSPDNRTALIEGGFGSRQDEDPNKIYQFEEKKLEEIIDNLTSEEVAVGKAVMKLLEWQGDQYEPVFLERNGYAMPREKIYFPKDVMSAARAEGVALEDQMAFERFKEKTLRVGVHKGQLEKRVGSKAAIYLNPVFQDVAKSVKWAASYIGLEIPLSDAGKLLYDKTFRTELSSRYDPIIWHEIENAMKDFASEYRSHTTVEKLALKFKNNLAVAVLGLDPFIMAKQVLSFPMYAAYVKPKYLMQGMVQYLMHPREVTQRLKEMSIEFELRTKGGFSRDVADVYKKGFTRQMVGGRLSVKEVLMSPIKFADKNTVAGGMMGAVLQVLDEIKEGKLSREVKRGLNITNNDIQNLTPEQKMALAYKYADFATERTQPMFAKEHQSPLQRGTPLEQLMTMFGSFTNQALNLLRRSYNDVQTAKDPDQKAAAWKKLAIAVFVIGVINPLGVMGINELRDKIYGREDEDEVWLNYIQTLAGYMFFVRDAAYGLTSKIKRGVFGYDINLSVFRPFNLIISAMAHGYNAITESKKSKRKKEALKMVDEGLNGILMLYGVPYYGPKKLTEAAIRAIEE